MARQVILMTIGTRRKIHKSITLVVLSALSLIALVLGTGTITGGSPSFVYVYSDSMEPLIKVNDGFIVWPAQQYEIGDIVLYRPVKLDASLVTHRITGLGDAGFITKGDNSPLTDQMTGEPQVEVKRIVGRVVTLINGKPLIIPGLGRLFGNISKNYRRYIMFIASGLIIFGIALLLLETRFTKRLRTPRRRWRLRDLYKLLFILALVIVLLGGLLGARVNTVKYLVSENPGNEKNHIRVNETDQLIIKVKNNGLLPIWHISTGVEPLEIKAAPRLILPRSIGEIIIVIPPHGEPGWYKGYVHIFHYPIILPYTLLHYLHQINPYFAVAVAVAVYCAIMVLLMRAINYIHGIELVLPVKAFKNKKAIRRLRRLSNKIPVLRRLQ